MAAMRTNTALSVVLIINVSMDVRCIKILYVHGTGKIMSLTLRFRTELDTRCLQ